mmetsp:Transcript_14784/g.21121  ORF Transcript_14784/g.21121 Transcript_14784/m.21121 type:complete len:378 (+) Transcript_14784:183-1316(+)|eukprot:CAMPEP_0184867418 /NCGR_PEP_ID=MMETSP0580-20130426/26435_1 /TAXON_ID=1118495 /ORGANISM="Dactyliosolen fragilissimus" /LENGTH=377 /DNA_ID=CAMNT_0027367691 /DNA_START=73 /DNA_END=1206 /DNA_ORIENTATION=+
MIDNISIFSEGNNKTNYSNNSGVGRKNKNDRNSHQNLTAIQAARKSTNEIFRAAQSGDIEALRTALCLGGDPNYYQREVDGMPAPILVTAGIGNEESFGMECTKALLESGASIHSTVLSTKNTPLHEAASKGSEEIVRLLIDHGAVADCKNAFGNTPLHSAVRSGSVDVVRLFGNFSNIFNATNNCNSTPLHYCAFLTAQDEGSLHSKSDSSTPRSTHKLGLDPYLQIAAILLHKGKDTIDVDIPDKNGYTPLHVASQKGCIDMIRLLVDSGASLVLKTNVDDKGRGGRTPAQMAHFGGKMEAFEILKRLERENVKQVENDHDVEDDLADPDLSRTNIATWSLAKNLESGYPISHPIVGCSVGGNLRKKSSWRDLHG